MISPEWNSCYESGFYAEYSYAHHLPLLMIQRCGKDLSGQRVLELGCGLGANVAWLNQLKAEYYGVDGSSSAIETFRSERPELADRVRLADFTQEIPFEGQFDIMFDRASVSHNDMDGIRSCVELILEALKPGGLYFGTDWFSTKHSEYGRGTDLGDGTRANYPDGQFHHVGKVRFSDEAEITHLFRDDFEPVFIQERVIRRPAPGAFLQEIESPRHQSRMFNQTEYRSALWDFAVRKL